MKIQILSYVMLALGVVLSGGVQALTYDTATARTATFGGEVQYPAYGLTWRWGTDSLTGVNFKITEMSGDKKSWEMTSIPKTTLIFGNAAWGVMDGTPIYPSVSWGTKGGSPRSTVMGQGALLRKIVADVVDSTNPATVLGSAEIVVTGLSAGTGSSVDVIPATPRTIYYIYGLLNGEADASSLCGQMSGNSQGYIGGDGTETAPPAGFNNLITALNALGTHASLPDYPSITASRTYVQGEVDKLHRLHYGTPAPTLNTYVSQVNVRGAIFPVATRTPGFMGDLRCGLGFIGTPGEKLKLTFTNPIAITTQWAINLTPTVSYN